MGFGTACTRVDERVEAIFGSGDGAVTHFEPCQDVPKGGVLCALPALLGNELLDGAELMLTVCDRPIKENAEEI